MSTMQPVVVAFPEKIANQAYHGLIAPATVSDIYIVDGSEFKVNNWDAWRHDRQVEIVTQMQMITYRVGGLLEICGLDQIVYCYGEITQIRMLEPNSVSDEDIALVGGSSPASWLEQTDGGYKGRHGLWMIEFNVLKDAFPSDTTGEPKHEIIVEIIKTSAGENKKPQA